MPILGSVIKKAIEIRSKIPVLLREKAPQKIQERMLKKLLKKAANTYFGDHYQFYDILKSKNVVKEFKNKVPVHDYNTMYKNWWYRCINGEPYVCWPGTVKYFALSSGTSEASSKYIPVTNSMLKAIKRVSIKQIFSLVQYDFPKEFFEKGMLMLGGSTHLQYNGTFYEGDLSGITVKNIPFWFQHHYKPGKRISRERDWTTKLDEIVKNAKNWDIGVICGVPAWLQILFEKIIAYYNLKTIHDIWPNLSIFVHGGVSFTPYKQGFEKLLAKPLIYIETYLASEGFIAFQSNPNSDSMHLALNNGLYFEFIPFNEKNFDENNNLVENPEALNLSEVEEGKDYALIISSCAGAWRYLIGDTIKFTSKKNVEIVITGRTKHFLNLCGEHLSVENMNQAVKMLADELKTEIKEFAVVGIKYESMFAHQWYLGMDESNDAENVKNRLDYFLKILNDDYRVERIEAIKDVFVKVLPTEIFYEFMRSKGKEGAQNKFPRVLKGQQLNDWEEFITIKGY
ncbi:MAG: GH3 auxin-responsive promoter family protein [Bacteroidales bacterium]|nr:GH3 auxin-responsive promoter family protein [Bacteroidales bacterium]